MKVLSMRKLALSLAAAWALAAIGLLALIQDGSKAHAGQQAKVNDRDLEAFVKAYVEYQEIQQEYGPTLMQAQEPEKKKEIQDDANAKVLKALAKRDLTVEAYNRIFKVVNSDDALRQKALKLIEAERKRS